MSHSLIDGGPVQTRRRYVKTSIVRGQEGSSVNSASLMTTTSTTTTTTTVNQAADVKSLQKEAVLSYVKVNLPTHSLLRQRNLVY